jgi:uncharacterized protein (TIGR00661 family)
VRIAYGVHGYGRGHAMRVLALLPSLRERHEVLVFAGGEAHGLLGQDLPAVRIPHLAFAYRGARISWLATLRRNAALVGDLLGGGPVMRQVRSWLEEFDPDVVVSDSEPFLLRAASGLGIPTIGLDHVGVIAHCRPRAEGRDRLDLAADGAMYRLLLGRADRVLVSSFFDVAPRRPGVLRVPPVLRDRVLKARPRPGAHLLVYFNAGRSLYAPHVDEALRALPVPAIVYGAGRSERSGNVTHRPIDEAAFVEDLASCRAVLATGGHQLISEALHLGKPILVAPESSAEQRLNAREVEALGAGGRIEHARISAAALRRFLDGERGVARPQWSRTAAGNAAALEALDAAVRELSASRRRPTTGGARPDAGPWPGRGAQA